MDEKDFKTTLDYLLTLYAIWYLIDYYADLLDIQKVSDPTKIPVDVVLDEKNILHILCRFKMRKDSKSKQYHRLDPHVEEDEIFNEFLTHLLQQNFVPLKPYQRGTNPENILEALYIAQIDEYGDYHEEIELDVIYISNNQAFDYIQKLISQRKRGLLL